MRIAFAYWKERIAPVFDTARFIRLIDAENHRVLAQAEEVLEQESPQPRIDRLVELRVGTLVCGAISRQLEIMITMRGIKVIPFVAGELETVIEAFLGRRLRGDSFKMPGCCGRLRHRAQEGRCGYGKGEMMLPGQWRRGMQDSGRNAVTPPMCVRSGCNKEEDGESTSLVSPGTLEKE